MTNQQYTPSTEQIKRLFLAVYPYPNPDEAFERWLAERDQAVEAAAEQRGAVRALRDAADIASPPIAEWLKYRANQLGAQDE